MFAWLLHPNYHYTELLLFYFFSHTNNSFYSCLYHVIWRHFFWGDVKAYSWHFTCIQFPCTNCPFVCWKMIINQMKPLWKCESVGAEPTAMKKNEKKVILFPKKCRILYKAAAIWGNARVLFVIWSPQRQRKFSSIVPPPKFCFNCKSHNLGVGCLALFPFNFASNF